MNEETSYNTCFACDGIIMEHAVTVEFRSPTHGRLRIHMGCFDGVTAERERLMGRPEHIVNLKLNTVRKDG